VDARIRTKLEERYKEKGLVLALGAGVTYESNVPTWDALIKGLAEGVDEEGKRPIYETLTEAGYGLPAMVSVIEDAYRRKDKDLKAFGKVIQKKLYERFRYKEGVDLKDEKERCDFIKHVGANETLRAIAALCAVKDGGVYKRNPRLHAVVTTNVDSVLRTYVRARYRHASGQEHDIVRTIERPSAGRVYDRIPIYYLHGLIRFDKDVEEAHKHAADLRVFTEQEFFDFFNNPNGLFSYTFLYLLREFSCVFLGMSLRDDNIRRLLHYSRKERFESKRYELSYELGRLLTNPPDEGEESERHLEKLARHLEVDKDDIPRDKDERARYAEERTGALADDDCRRHFFIDRHPRFKCRDEAAKLAEKEGRKLTREDERLADEKGERQAELTEVSLGMLGVNVLWLDEYSEIPGLFEGLYKSANDGHGSWADVYDLKCS